ncbi:FAD-dependent oxidoreductase [Pseudonocardia endophytica]|uniref:FAD binding domain-containing protein n=1 Tax=Pseudonocardia endophytica TaxID=401976 RepID=A0A4R1HN59_PSEEN|nr:FAD-dependent oxidoreductase [Pseudonocardia endophytica]TCK21109.1 FAD binding domain-containing protein [Pseudonocardia endophytica]
MTGWDDEVDLLVLGAGGAGLTAALVAASEGLSALVLEKSPWVGGTTARSAGTVWVPGHRHTEDGTADVAAARRYLDELVGDHGRSDLRESYLTHAPAAVEHLERLGVRFRHAVSAVDYHPNVPGAGVGRALEPCPFDGRRLGRAAFGRVRAPLPEFALLGGSLMLRRAEAERLLTPFPAGALGAMRTAARLGARWVADRGRGYPRGTRLTLGNALVAALYERLLAASVPVWFTARADELVVDAGGRVSGVRAVRRGRAVRIRARRGVVLACGGFAASQRLRAELCPDPTPQFSPAVPETTGESLALARSAGGSLGDHDTDNAMWFPSSVGRRRDGSTAVHPHIWDRARPGLVAVARDGRRFVDESVSYHRFVRAMYSASRAQAPAIPAWLVTDAPGLRRYGLGLVRPYLPVIGLRRHLDEGYLVVGSTARALATRIGVDPDGLDDTLATVGRAGGGGQTGVTHGAIRTPPFYAVAVVPTPLSTTYGVRTDHAGRVITESGRPVPGLYACGDDARSFTASEYPGPGCRIGAAVTFAYLVARDAARNEHGADETDGPPGTEAGGRDRSWG